MKTFFTDFLNIIKSPVKKSMIIRIKSQYEKKSEKCLYNLKSEKKTRIKNRVLQKITDPLPGRLVVLEQVLNAGLQVEGLDKGRLVQGEGVPHTPYLRYSCGYRKSL